MNAAAATTGGTPRVTVGIPTYNRDQWLVRSIESALHQDYPNLEVIVSDNASADGTPAICESFARRDARFSFVRMAENRGATANFNEVLALAKGEFFMWLGDDDWIDPGYVSRCVDALRVDPGLALASGQVLYYRNGGVDGAGAVLDVGHESAALRVLEYYWRVTDNGMFYGVMRTEHLRRASFRGVMGGDWHVIASVLAGGRATTLPDIRVHRELGGASASPEAIARSLKLSRIHLLSPTLSIASSAFGTLSALGDGPRNGGRVYWWLVALATFFVILVKHGRIYAAAVPRKLRLGVRSG